ncbi:MAG: SDR family NAD(P)-dependent oxidoreductase [Anaerolineales bacterium]|nr:SDR family NAD(P)-dependent oxidoreductase [Anaerolineales bacterium]
MAQNFHQKGIIVTGAASGIGRATAVLLAQSGANLALWDVNEAALQAVAQETGGLAQVVDISQPAQVVAAMDTAVVHLGSLAGVVHSAGVLATGYFEQIPLAKHEQLIQVNLLGSTAVAHSALPYLAETHGSLIFLASTSALYGPPEYASYGATKAGVLALAQALRLETAEQGIHIGAVIPSFVDTPMNANHNPGVTLYERFGVSHTAVDVAQAIVSQGLVRRRFHIWPGVEPRLLYVLSWLARPWGDKLMRLFWR